jgi:hypothetical protein
MINISRRNAAVGLALVAAGVIGFGAGDLLRSPTNLALLTQLWPVLVAAIPALAAYVRTGKVASEATEIKEAVAEVKAQTNGTTSSLVDMTSRAVDALALIANDPAARQRAAGLLRTIEAALPDQPHPEETGNTPAATVPPDSTGGGSSR